jgi:hypothetical protein
MVIDILGSLLRRDGPLVRVWLGTTVKRRLGWFIPGGHLFLNKSYIIW